jgi:hypothetical protein
MTIADTSSSILSRRSFLGFRFKGKGSTPKQSFIQPDLSSNYTHVSRDIPRQAHNPAIHPLLAKPIAREENFVLLPKGNGSMKRKRDPNSPVRSSIKPKPRDSELSEWSRYLASYAEVNLPYFAILMLVKGRFNMSNPPEPPSNRPAGNLKAPIPLNDAERVKVSILQYGRLITGIARVL